MSSFRNPSSPPLSVPVSTARSHPLGYLSISHASRLPPKFSYACVSPTSPPTEDNFGPGPVIYPTTLLHQSLVILFPSHTHNARLQLPAPSTRAPRPCTVAKHITRGHPPLSCIALDGDYAQIALRTPRDKHTSSRNLHVSRTGVGSRSRPVSAVLFSDARA